MRVSIETTSGLERRLTIGVPADRVDGAVAQRLREAARNVRLPGFRPGKVPMKVMQQRFGGGIRQEVIGEVINQSFQEAVISEKLRPAGQPRIEPRALEAGRDVEYTATFEIFPTLEINEITDLKIERPVAEVNSADVDEIIEIFRKQRGELKDVERAAETGDTVLIDFAGTRDGEAFDGGTGEDHSLELGSGKMIPGFEDGIVGMSAGDQKSIDVTFPDDYSSEELQGADAAFAITCKSVKALELAPLDEELFASYGVEEGGEPVFREEVQKNMERELRNAVQTHIKNQVMDGVVAAHEDIEIPSSLVAQEIDGMRGQMFQQFGGQAAPEMDLKSILPDEMFKDQAERRVKLGLLLGEMITKFELRADPAKVKEAIEDIASTYQEPEEVINWYYSENEQLAQVESRVLEDQVVDKILEGAEIEDQQSTYQDALAAARPAQS
ncbi:MAG: trigger factor [Halieaceae bacterium]|jgi:trigger factor|nr:trigger factor [Halieaceae bacterium]MDG1492498.1 trigger factor [Luminiphilus sp.]MBT5207776.1 trigger factor [Halieaceae bacterium]MBT6266036.1 trigger factor [Halieaceae bacterium]MBT7339614.1 trigger factor [Halieaceae bacterium]